MVKKRRVFEQGHRRKFLVVVDEVPEVEAALFFAASRIGHTGGQILLLYVIEPQDYHQWMGVKQAHLEEEANKAKALFRLNRMKLTQAGFTQIATDDVVREGEKAEEIVKLIEEDEDIAILVLGASTDAKGPGPLVSSLAAGKRAGTFPIPIVVVPGNLSLEDLKALA
ncbi:MAG TPA: universal stress protein [Hyphomicrobiaceae bacterium]|nr:universal stress protein [Hyphomicrobiaceae bacterium]